jgi:uncharacterized protein (DUF1778 family)
MATTEKPKTNKPARLALRLSADHKERIERAAAMTGQTINSFASAELVKRSDEILEKEEMRLLSNRDRDLFLALLDADPETTEAAQEAVARFNQGRYDGERYHFKA